MTTPTSVSDRTCAAAWQRHARALLVQAGCGTLAALVQVRWNPRMRSTAGTADCGRNLVSLNPHLLAVGDAEVDRTLRHELAHLLAWHRRVGRRRLAPHGPEWRQACRELGIAGEERCHELPLPRRRLARRYRYWCPACRVVVARVRPLRRPAACARCCRTHNAGRWHEEFRLRAA